jgi:hypothetical protein
MTFRFIPRRGLAAGHAVLALAILGIAQNALAQQSQNPQPTVATSRDTQKPVLISPPEAPTVAIPPHRFWDRTNILLFSGVAVFRGLDYASTRNFQARGRTEILLAQAVVNNSAAFASVEAGGAATSVALSYLFHRTGHHKMERWLSIGHISVTAFGVGWNYSLKSKHPH